MNEREIREIVARVVEQYTAASGSGCAKGGECETNDGSIMLEASARHVHLTQNAVERLFGKDEVLREVRPLSQPGQFLSDKRVRLVTKKGAIDNVAVLGPVRSEIQVELSLTDLRSLGLSAPVNMSGNLSGAADVVIFGETGMLTAEKSVIAAKSHIHMRPCDAEKYGVSDGERVSVRVESERPVTFDDVIIRVNESFAPAMHIDFDEANACALSKSTRAYIKRK